MMVNTLDDDRNVVALQTDHSRVAGYLAANWGNAYFAQPEPREAMVLAAQEHDNGWWDWEVAPTMSEDGLPLDYIGSFSRLGDGVWLDLAHKSANRLKDINLYSALMVRMHADGLLTQAMGLLPRVPDRTHEAGVPDFLREGEMLRSRWREELAADPEWAPHVTEAALWTNYKYLEVFDQLAQIICNRYPLNSQARSNGPALDLSSTPVPVHPTASDTTIKLRVLDERRMSVSPYPFNVSPLVVSFEARILPNRAFSDLTDFRATFYGAQRFAVEYELVSSDEA